MKRSNFYHKSHFIFSGIISNDAQVNVKCAPLMKHKLKNIVVNEGDTNVELTVTSDGFPK